MSKSEEKKRTDDIVPLTWLRIPEYAHAWLERELGGDIRVHGKKVLSVAHLPGSRDILRMKTREDTLEQGSRYAMSALRMDMLKAGMMLDADTVKRDYNVTGRDLCQFLPVECPRVTMVDSGVLRPWTRIRCFSDSQGKALNKLLRETFWQAVADYDAAYAEKKNGEYYPAKEMIEAFCGRIGMTDVWVDDLRREWQRRNQKKG